MCDPTITLHGARPFGYAHRVKLLLRVLDEPAAGHDPPSLATPVAA